MRNRVTEKEARRRARLAELREATRAYRDDQGHTWRETAEHFGIKEIVQSGTVAIGRGPKSITDRALRS